MIHCTQRLIGAPGTSARWTADITLPNGVVGRVIEHTEWSGFRVTFDGYIPIVFIPGRDPIIYHTHQFSNTKIGFRNCAKDALKLALEWSAVEKEVTE